MPFAWHTTRAKLAAVFCAVLIIGPVLNDLLRAHVNLTILFLVPMMFCAWIGQRHLLRKVLLLCIVLTYLGLSIRLWLHPSPYWRWGVINRTFIVIALLIGGYLLEAMLTNLQHRAAWRPEHVDADHVIIEEIIFSSQSFAAILAAVALGGIIFVVDLITPGQLNCPILYSVPLLLIIWTRSHLWLWCIASLLIALAVVGCFVGAAPTIAPSMVNIIMANRLIAICMLLFFAVIMHLATMPYPKGDR